MLDPNVAALLQEATNTLARHRGDRFEQFDCIRLTMSQITRVDAFYVGEFVDLATVHYHHQYDEEVFDLPGSLPVTPGGVAHWVRANRRTYTFAEDDGKTLHAGRPFGQHDKRSRDALVAPIFDDTDERSIIGLVSVQSYLENTYGPDSVGTLEYLADALGAQITHEQRGARRHKRLSEENLELPDNRTADEALGDVLVSLGKLHGRLNSVIAAVDRPDVDPGVELRALRRDVERLQSELWSRELHYQRLIADRLERLSPRPKELARFLAELPGRDGTGPSTAELAARMGISEVTVKSHMNAVLRAFGASERSEVRSAVRRLITPWSHQL
jgi:DNA-directed RNA polymerase specialized sigma24 family protein